MSGVQMGYTNTRVYTVQCTRSNTLACTNARTPARTHKINGGKERALKRFKNEENIKGEKRN